MKKLLITLLFSLFASASFAQPTCPTGMQTQPAKWSFINSQCMRDSLYLVYADTGKVAYIDAAGVVTTISYAELLVKLNVPPTDSAIFATRRYVDSLYQSITVPTIWTTRLAADTIDWRTVAYGNGIYVSVAFSGTNRVQISTDGINWRQIVSTVANASQWRAITFGNGLFVAVAGNPGAVMTSTDGINWVSRTQAVSNDWRDVNFGNGLFVAVSFAGNSSNRIMTSPDGITWTSRATASSASLRSVAYGNGMWVIGSNTDMLSSPDGITWTIRSAAQTNFWQRITYGNGLFVAVSFDGTNRVQTSPDGITWTIRNAAENNDWESVVYGNGLYVAVASTGTNRIMTSFDGITWSPYPAVANSWRWVTFGNGMFVSVGNSGAQRVQTSGRTDFNLKSTANSQGRIQYNGSSDFRDTTVHTVVVIGSTPTVTTATNLLTNPGSGGVISALPWEQGVYTPADSGRVNLDALTLNSAMYTRIGDQVTVVGTFTTDATASGTTTFFMTIPVASNMAAPYVAGEGGALINTTPLIDFGTTQKVRVRYVSGAATAQSMTYRFTYRIQ